MGDLTADIEGLRAASVRFAAAAADVRSAFERVHVEVDGRDRSVWGGDEPGGVFGEGYEPAHADAMATLLDIHQRLVAAATGVDESARVIEEQDRTGADGLDTQGTPCG